MKQTCLRRKGQGSLTGAKRTVNAAKASSARTARSVRKGKEKQKGSKGTKNIVTWSRNRSLLIIDSMLMDTGGQRSLGEESYQGAKGGFVFVCPSTGTIKVKLYATSEQFPAILYQVLQEVEAEGYACREIYVDTFKVNFSKAAEEVAAMFRVRLVPVSAGTPQEMAYAESAVRVIGEMSRSLMAGAPHLDESCWGLADVQAAYIHNFMPQQSKEDMSPYERKTFRTPDLDAMFVRVFGCPAQYEPYKGALHKRVGLLRGCAMADGSDFKTR